MKKILSAIKPFLRWLIWGGTLFFLLKAFKDHWREVTAVRIDQTGWLMLAIALLVTMIAHFWSGWVWTWILRDFRQPLRGWQAMQVYLITNIAKYLPGNVWHFYGRITAVSKAGGSLGVASLSVLLEPLLMAAAALLVALVSSSFGWLETSDLKTIGLQITSLSVVLVGIDPRILNRVIDVVGRSKQKVAEVERVELKQYPILPLLGEIGFLLLRGTGFVFTLLALMPIAPNWIPQLLSVFSFAWLLGLVIPGAPGGMGIFEATAIAFLDQQYFPTGAILGGVAIFRLISITAEAITAGLAWISAKISRPLEI